MAIIPYKTNSICLKQMRVEKIIIMLTIKSNVPICAPGKNAESAVPKYLFRLWRPVPQMLVLFLRRKEKNRILLPKMGRR